MPIKDDKIAVQVVLDKDVVYVIDKVADMLGMNRSAFIRTCVETGLEDWNMLVSVGATPQRIRRLADYLLKYRVIKKGRFEVKLDKLRKFVEERSAELGYDAFQNTDVVEVE